MAILVAGSEDTLAGILPQIPDPRAAGIAFLVVQMLFVPCVGTITAIKQETGSWRWTVFSVAYLARGSPFGVGILVYQGARLLGLGV